MARTDRWGFGFLKSTVSRVSVLGLVVSIALTLVFFAGQQTAQAQYDTCPCLGAPPEAPPCLEDCCNSDGSGGSGGGPPSPGPGGCGRVHSSSGVPCMAAPPAATSAPVYLRWGSVIEKATDLDLPGPAGGWSQTRTYNSMTFAVTQLGGAWFSSNGNTRLSDPTEYGYQRMLIYNATSSRQFIDNYYNGDYDGPKDCSYKLIEEQSGLFAMTDRERGDVLVFDEAFGVMTLLTERTNLAWRAAGKDGIQYTHVTDDEKISQITTAEGQDYNIVFTYTGDNIEKIEVRTGSTSDTRVQQVEYTYFDDTVHSSDLGGDGDLVQVKVSKLKTGGSVSTAADWMVRYIQYRYDSNRHLTAVFESDSIQRLIDGRSDITDADDILAKGDDDDNSGAEDHKISDYANRRFTYYTVDVKTDNSGAGTTADPKCVTVWNANGENLQGKYGGNNLNEHHVAGDFDYYMVKTEEVGACVSCGGSGGGVKKEYFYFGYIYYGNNATARLVVEDTIDADGNGLYRTVYAINEFGRKLREVKISDPDGTPSFWAQSWKFNDYYDLRRHRLAEYRTPAAHNVTASTVDEYLSPSVGSNDANTLNSSAGRIHVYETDSNGFRTAEKVKKGNTGTAYYLWAADYTGGTNLNRQHLVTSRYVYPTAATSKTDASRVQTQYQ